MQIKLIALSLINFKGARKQLINFFDITDISGRNATGKTTIFDAFLWLLFGKDSTDRKDFELKTLDENNVPFHRLEHEVTGTFLFDGIETIIRRTFREKWVKKKGSAEAEFSGHETAYFWNDVPMSEKEFQVKIAALTDEKVFKLITNTAYFNSLKWQDRRAVLMSLAGKIDNTEILDTIATLDNKNEVLQLTNALNQNKSIDEFKREIGAKKKVIKDEMLLIPSRIDEVKRGLPDEVDYSEIEQQIETVNTDIDTIDGMLQNKSKAAKDHADKTTGYIRTKQQKQQSAMQREFELKAQVEAGRNERTTKITAEQTVVDSRKNAQNYLRKEYTHNADRLKLLTEQNVEVVKKFDEIDGKQLIFDANEFSCPACKRAYETNDVEAKKSELTKNFNLDKSTKLTALKQLLEEITTEATDIKTKLGNINADGQKISAEITEIENRIEELKKEDTRLKETEVDQLATLLRSDTIFQDLKNEIDGLDELINAPFEAEDNSALLQRKKELTTQLDELKNKTANKGQREKQLLRIEELQDQESTMAQELASFEGIEFCIEKFTKAKMDILINRINGRFSLVTFKLFEEQINGGQVECCETLINGVPYSDANTASKINAGLDIINTLSQHFDVFAPVFVDNAESVNTLIPINSQLIRLVVTDDKKLQIVGHEAAAELKQN